MSELADLITPESQSRSDFLSECNEGKFCGVSVVFRTFHSVQLTGRFDEELVGILPDSIKFICHNGRSYFQSNYL